LLALLDSAHLYLTAERLHIEQHTPQSLVRQARLHINARQRKAWMTEEGLE
jgi:hypothetical protein